MDLLFNVSAFLAVVTTGIVTGTVFAYGNSVMPGLKQTDDRTFVLAVRKLNSSVDNIVFLLISNFALIAQIILVIVVYVNQLAGTIFYVLALIGYISTLLITFLGNLPLNKAIISAELPTDELGWIKLRSSFESRWTSLNNLRTLTCLLSVTGLLIAIFIG
ncbi:DUF1772 domain-containing protein (plasmid) [Niallia circulans]|uniref:DUF1772 domain-containing protein n=1 Tax=Niallia circulans TaxID=1397 RepID=A0A553SQF0_NIACI|nr:anthrone oxygenase family protein [Niallia circulans]TRZ39219.1 DUF1772 domain-containing protein [Niallia circulans]